mmetsp:Transcript_38143/g.61959  ORF Transcript_38143/g.61959 Transcript_38143/m.61959 type:complete len:151 (-) Transcript_38143:293-745(-)
MKESEDNSCVTTTAAAAAAEPAMASLLFVPAFKPNQELVMNLKMRRRLKEIDATDKEILDALRQCNNVGRKAIALLKTGKVPTHRKGESMTGLANTMAANICHSTPRNSLDAGDARSSTTLGGHVAEDVKSTESSAEAKINDEIMSEGKI